MWPTQPVDFTVLIFIQEDAARALALQRGSYFWIVEQALEDSAECYGHGGFCVRRGVESAAEVISPLSHFLRQQLALGVQNGELDVIDQGRVLIGVRLPLEQ